jgi:hypothetical protein
MPTSPPCLPGAIVTAFAASRHALVVRTIEQLRPATIGAVLLTPKRAGNLAALPEASRICRCASGIERRWHTVRYGSCVCKTSPPHRGSLGAPPPSSCLVRQGPGRRTAQAQVQPATVSVVTEESHRRRRSSQRLHISSYGVWRRDRLLRGRPMVPSAWKPLVLLSQRAGGSRAPS